MAVCPICNGPTYRLSYQKKLSSDPMPKYYKTNRYYCEKCDILSKMVAEG